MKYFIVDAFTDKVFGGNPAAVCIIDEWLSDEIMQSIATENNLSETAFAVKTLDRYHIRWFTPGGEIDLCGHATLATAYVISNFYERDLQKIIFDSMSGELIVTKKGDLFELDFPRIMPQEFSLSDEMVEALGVTPLEVYLARDIMFVLDSEETVLKVAPNFAKLKELADGVGVIITATGKDVDFVSRAFYPKLNVNEDPVTGSAHSNLIPYWSKKLGKKEMVAKQLSKRGGILYCIDAEERVYISGYGSIYAQGEIFI